MPSATPHLPMWALYVQVFGTIFAAAIAAIIASIIQYRQWKLAQEKFRLDLFDKRTKIYAALFSDIMIVDGDAAKQQSVIKTTLAEMRDYRFLFDSETVEQIEIARTYLMMIYSECKSKPLSHECTMQYFRDFDSVLDKLSPIMINYLRFE